MSAFRGDTVSPAAGLRAILDSYPFSTGLFRELIQNSDDAGASIQVLLLDRRTHPDHNILHHRLKNTQGVALLGYNNALVTEDDWEHLQTMHRSSKTKDSTRIGKYGQGFRASYHITDNPQVLSGTSLAIFDPLGDQGGFKVDFVNDNHRETFTDHLISFNSFLPESAMHYGFQGTVFRLPLRLDPTSSISSNTPSADDIRTLLDEFIANELKIILLFLNHLQEIRIEEIDRDGRRVQVVSAKISRDPVVQDDYSIHSTNKCTIIIGDVQEEWRIGRSSFPHSLVSEHFDRQFHTSLLLAKHKLHASVGIAVPLSATPTVVGRLFAFLPLPLLTGFPFHIHGVFAVTQDRQHLRNNGEAVAKGSDDAFFVEWNRYLFNHALPSALAALLPVLIEFDGFQSTFSIWPRMLQDGSLWANLALDLLHGVLEADSPIWPTVGPGVTFERLHSVLLIKEDGDEGVETEVLETLAKSGLMICCVPEFILDIVCRSEIADARLLTPKTVNEELKKPICFEKLAFMDKHDGRIILDYLLSTRDVGCIADLPLIPFINGSYGSLIRRTPDLPSRVYTLLEDGDIHTLLEDRDASLWGDFEDHAIRLSSLPAAAQEVLSTLGPAVLNVERLTAKKVVEYLSISPNPVDLELFECREIDQGVISWLTKFWLWVRERKFEDELELGELWLLPIHHGGLRQVGKGVFRMTGVHPALLSALTALRVPFLHANFPEGATVVLKKFGVLRDVSRLSELCESIQPGHVVDPNSAGVLLAHVAKLISGQSPVGERVQTVLRSIPMFPILSHSMLMVSHNSNVPAYEFRALSNVDEVYVVQGSTRPALLPILPEVTYYHDAAKSSFVLGYLGCQVLRHLSGPVDILTLASEHFCEQPKSIQVAFVLFMAQNRDSIPPKLLHMLRTCPFVRVSADPLAPLWPPSRIVDPESDIACLYDRQQKDTPIALPARNEDSFLLGQLRQLGVLQHELTAEVVNERVRWISSHQRDDVSLNLLKLLSKTRFDCGRVEVEIIRESRWLPTKVGLRSSLDCRKPTESCREELFDEVLSVLDPSIVIGPSLRTSLGWDQPLPFSILQHQLDRLIVGGKRYEAIEAVLDAFASRVLSLTELDELRKITAERPWVPISTSTRPRCLSTTRRTLICGTKFWDLPGFHVAFPSSTRYGVFLYQMGCQKRPAKEELLAVLEIEGGKKWLNVDAVLSILQHLPDDLTDDERSRVFIPDHESRPRSLQEVYFDDIGDSSAPSGFFLAHPKVTKSLADQLGIESLRLTSLEDLDDDGEDYGEKFTTKIRNLLEHQYTDQQTLTEFLANASDAGATRFEILLDEMHGPCNTLLSPAMAPFQTCPSLVIYNDGVFTDKDWSGIRNVGLGGKQDRENAIGKFGLGALSAFHFSEMMMIVSGDSVMFLDPTKQHLFRHKFKARGFRRVSLKSLRLGYADHLTPLHGLFGFDVFSTDFYNGTIFRLPLRTEAHFGSSPILEKTFTNCNTFRDEITRDYHKQAVDSMLFIDIGYIASACRRVNGQTVIDWSVQTVRESPWMVETFQRQVCVVSSTKEGKVSQARWMVATSRTEVPHRFARLISGKHIRSLANAGLAAVMSGARPDKHNFFSILPLQITTPLPVHVHASFILSPDRRSIRLDQPDEASYNNWLLANVLPPLYLFLLEGALANNKDRDTYYQLWPAMGSRKIDEQNPSEILVNSLYSDYLSKSNCQVFQSRFCLDERLTPRDVLVSREEPPRVRHILSKFYPVEVVRLPRNVPWDLVKATGIRALDGDTVRNILLRYQCSSRSLYSCAKWSAEDFSTLIHYIFEHCGEDGLLGLQLLPLSTGEWHVFERMGHGKTYFVTWKRSKNTPSLFRASDTVDSVFMPDVGFREIVTSKLNVSLLSPAAASGLIRAAIDEMGQPTPEWVDQFWRDYTRLPGKTPIAEFPLVHASGVDHYISMSQCTLPTVVVVPREPRWLGPCLETLGATVVQKEDLPVTLRRVLQPSTTSLFHDVLTFLRTMQHSLASGITNLPEPQLERFTTWVKNEISTMREDLTAHLDIARTLPIWLMTHATSSSHIAARDIACMLPRGLPSSLVERYMTVAFTEYSYLLERLGVQSSSPWENMQLPNVLTRPSELRSYHALIAHMMQIGSSDNNQLRVPNGNGVLCSPTSLFRREPLFVAAFVDESSFLHPQFADLEDRLRLRSWATAFESAEAMDLFAVCARSIDGYTGRDKVERASVLYRAYSEDLPPRVGVAGGYLWSRLSDLRFIPRDDVRRRGTWTFLNVGIREFPEVVSPAEVLLDDGDERLGVKNLQSIAWTQRVLCSVRPSPALLALNPEFGRPSAEEVIDHLRVLAQIADEEGSNAGILFDLEDTYRWLDYYSPHIQPLLLNLHAEPLFLNIETSSRTSSEAWEWHSADNLFFSVNSQAEETEGNLRIFPVRLFLRQFKNLLRSAGVVSMSRATCPPPEISSLEERLAGLMERSQRLRLEEKHIDVVFNTEDGGRLGAHRVFLAAMAGEHFLHWFAGDFDGATEGRVEVDVDISEACMSFILDYLYTGRLPEDEGSLETLLEVMGTAHRWELADLFKVIQEKIVGYVRLKTYKEIRAKAELLDAQILLQACLQWESNNRDAINRFSVTIQ